MPRIIIFNNDSHRIELDAEKKQLTLVDNRLQDDLIQANYKFDETDSAALLSHFVLLSGDDSANARILADMVSTYLSSKPGPCKLFCFAGEQFEKVFADSKDFRSTKIDRLMLRETKKLPELQSTLSYDVTIEPLNPDNVTEGDKEEILKLLKQTYWAKDAKSEYVETALKHSVLYVAYDNKRKIIGLVRFISDNRIAYISDMVVEEAYRKQHIATHLLVSAFKMIDESHEISALISAREGDGKDAAEKLYGSKFGFIRYDERHQYNVQFRYIKHNPEIKLSVTTQSIFKVAVDMSSVMQTTHKPVGLGSGLQ